MGVVAGALGRAKGIRSDRPREVRAPGRNSRFAGLPFFFFFFGKRVENVCTPVVRSSSVVMAQNAELVSLLVDGCRYGDMEDVTEGENRRNRDPSHGRKGVCALQSDSGSDRSEN